METLNLLQWVPSGIGSDQVLREKSGWHGHGRILLHTLPAARWSFPGLLFSTQEKWHRNNIKVGTQAIESQDIQSAGQLFALSKGPKALGGGGGAGK